MKTAVSGIDFVKLGKIVVIGAVIFLYSLCAVLQSEIMYLKLKHDMVEAFVVLPGEFISMFVIGGFRALAADVLWLKADDFFHRGEWHRMYPIYRVITWLQPHFVENWCIGGWHLGYNLYYYARHDPELQQEFLGEGISFLKEGIVKNRKKFKIYETLAWLYRHKLEDYDNAIKFFKAATLIEHPSRIERMMAHMYREKGDLEGEYKQWQRCLTMFNDEPAHMELTRKHLARVKKMLGIE